MIKWLKKNVGFAAVRRFVDVFHAPPACKCQSAFVEIGEYNEERDCYAFEGHAPLYVAPDGSVWARVCDSVSQLPFEVEG